MSPGQAFSDKMGPGLTPIQLAFCNTMLEITLHMGMHTLVQQLQLCPMETRPVWAGINANPMFY